MKVTAMTINALFIVAALVVFILVALGVTAGHLDALRLTAVGLALLTAGHLAWRAP